MDSNVSTLAGTNELGCVAFAVLGKCKSDGVETVFAACLTADASTCSGRSELCLASSGASVLVEYDETSVLGNRPFLGIDPASEYAWCVRGLRVLSGEVRGTEDILADIECVALHHSLAEIQLDIKTDKESPVQILDDRITSAINAEFGLVEDVKSKRSHSFGTNSVLLFNRVNENDACLGMIKVGNKKVGLYEASIWSIGHGFGVGSEFFFDWKRKQVLLDEVSGEFRSGKVLNCSARIAEVKSIK